MTIQVTKEPINLREKLNELETNKGLKGNEILQAETAQEVRSLIGAGRKNLIINGGFDVWQRGTSQTASGYGSADRWYCANAGAMAKDTDANGNPIVKFTTNGHTDPYLFTIIEDGVRILRGKTITFSCYIKSTHPDPIQFLYLRQYGSGTPLTGKATISSSEVGWDRYVLTTVIPDSWTANDHLFTDLEFTGGMTTDIWVKNVQLEVGSVATDFEHRSYGEELALCQRYFQKSYTDGIYAGTNTTVGIVIVNGSTEGGSNSYQYYTYPVPMRAAASITFYNSSGASGVWQGNSSPSSSATRTVALDYSGTAGFYFHVGLVNTWVVCQVYGHFTADAEL